MFFLSIYPVLWIYNSPISGLNCGDFCFLFLFVLYLLRGGPLLNRFNSRYLLLWLWFAVSLIITATPFKITYLIPGGIRFFVYSIVLFLVLNTFNYFYFIKFFRVFFMISAVIFFMQFFMHLFTGRSFSALIPFMSLTDGLSTSALIHSQIRFERPASFFREPAHYAQIVCVFLVLELFGNKEKLFNFSPLAKVGTVILLLLSSGNASMILFVVYGYFLYYYLKTVSLKRKAKTIVAIVPLIFLGVFTAFKFGDSFFLIARAAEISSEVETATSGYLRVIRGYEVFDVLPTFNKILGSSEETILEFENYSKSTFFKGILRYDLYFNGIQTVLLYKGIIGLGLFLYLLFGLYRNNIRVSKVLITSFILLSFIADTYLYPIMLFTFVFSMYYKTNISKKPDRNETNENCILY